MRKILLASTALVAMTSVSAMATDITISGSSELVLDMGDSATTDQSDFVTEHDISIGFSNTSDSGITTSMSYGMDDANNAADDLSVTISGDFGSISYTGGSDDHALTARDNEANGTTEERAGTMAGSYTGGLPGFSNQHLTYAMPSIVDNLGVAITVANNATDGEAAAYAVTYSTDMISVVYGEVLGHTQTDTHIGVGLNFGAAGINLARNTNDQAAHDNEATLIGVTYAVSPEMTLGLEMDKGETGTTSEDYKMTAFGASYAIATGLSASITSAETDFGSGGTDTNYTSIGLHLSW